MPPQIHTATQQVIWVQRVRTGPMHLIMQVAEVRETQPDCRLYIAITKCDQLDDPPSIAEQDTGEPDSSSSSSGDCPDLLQTSALLSHASAYTRCRDAVWCALQ